MTERQIKRVKKRTMRKELAEERRRQRALKKAKTAVEKVEKGATGFWADFKKFVAKGNMIDLAVAVVVSTAFNKVVNSIVSNIITPLTTCLLPNGSLAEREIVLKPAIEADEGNGIAAVPAVALKYGAVFQALIDFLIIALSIFLVLKFILKLKNAIRAKEIKAAEARAKAAAEKKKQEEKEAAEREEKIRREFIEDVAVQADVLTDIKEILLRIEKKSAS